MKCLCLFANPHQHLQPLKLITQLKEQVKPILRGVCLYDTFNNLTALFSQFASKRVFMITAEAPDNLLKIDRQV